MLAIALAAVGPLVFIALAAVGPLVFIALAAVGPFAFIALAVGGADDEHVALSVDDERSAAEACCQGAMIAFGLV